MKNKIIALSIFGFLQTSLFVSSVFAASQPNVVLVLMDNFAYGELGSYGGGEIRGAATPELDKLAKEGLRLTNFNVEAQCVPSRAALMTGRYAIRSGNAKVPFDRQAPYGPTQWEYTMAEMFSDAGYSTAMFGKWHLGHTEGRFPSDHGFDMWWGLPNSTDEALWVNNSRISDEIRKMVPKSEILTSVKGQKVPTVVKPFDLKQRALMDGELTDMAVDYIKEHANSDKPYFLYVPYTQTHQPRIPHPDFDGKTGNGTWGDILAQIDAYNGKLLEAIKESGTQDNTIFIFTSDNGGDFFDDASSPGPWRGTYFTGLEGSLRVPFIIRWPKEIYAGSVSNEIVHEMDLLATLTTAANGKLPDDRIIDSLDMTDFFTGKVEKSPRESVIAYVADQIYAVKWHNWKAAFKELDAGYGSEVKTYQTPTVYNLYNDPREEKGVSMAGIQENGWVGTPIINTLGAHLKTLKDEPPIKEGALDPYVPKAVK